LDQRYYRIHSRLPAWYPFKYSAIFAVPLAYFGEDACDFATHSLPAAGVVFRDVHVQGYSRLRALRALSRERREVVTAELAGMLERGELRSEIDARYPLEEAKAALAHHERPGRRGKIVLIS
jgi:NADPH:quinone reductase-like Zn-dependent oxidoreductase